MSSCVVQISIISNKPLKLINFMKIDFQVVYVQYYVRNFQVLYCCHDQTSQQLNEHFTQAPLQLGTFARLREHVRKINSHDC